MKVGQYQRKFLAEEMGGDPRCRMKGDKLRLRNLEIKPSLQCHTLKPS